MKRAARWGLAAASAVVLLGLVIHVPPIRGWLAAHGHHGGDSCPFGYGTAARHRGDPTAPHAHARPALGFALGTTTAAEIARWATDHATTCRAKRGGTFLECADPSASTSIWLQLDEQGVLEAVQATRREPTAAMISDAFVQRQAELTAQVGAPTRHDGSSAPNALTGAALRQAMVEYRFSDYHALVRATNMGDGYVLTEEYTRLD
ncbi:MAG TPA: hypothetical protein VMJ10_00450 [Kofleriaceae bacterium]|nr:hypothetical protein [Kofleriaceae bacterium]